MTKLIKRTNSPNQRGFTLIELLVVIVILGILAAVVVFAVRGVGDKGRSNAIATDKRILRTALETYCAQKGHYPTADPTATPPLDAMGVLVAEKFLSSRSTYHTLGTGDDTAEFKEGRCPATPMHYKLDDGPDNGDTRTGTCTDPPATWRSGLFCQTGTRGTTPADIYDPSLPPALQLPDGRVLALSNGVGICEPASIELYTPATGQWTPGPVGACAGAVGGQGLSGANISMVLISETAGACGLNCGKVLFYTDDSGQFPRERWFLYDPTGPTGTLTDITPVSVANPRPEAPPQGLVSVLQITGPNCGPNCGKILISNGFPPDTRFPAPYRLFDPTNPVPHLAFTTVDSPPFPKSSVANSLVGLPNGKILVFGREALPAPGHAFSMLFNPADSSFDVTTPPPSHQYGTEIVTSVRLATGEVLVTGISYDNAQDDGKADIFDPSTSQWRTVPKCTPAGSGCFAMTTVGGKVLSKTTNYPYNWDYRKGDMYLFDPKTKGSSGAWKTLAEAVVPPVESVRTAVTLGGTGCNPYCGKALIVGQRGKPAYLYAP